MSRLLYLSYAQLEMLFLVITGWLSPELSMYNIVTSMTGQCVTELVVLQGRWKDFSSIE